MLIHVVTIVALAFSVILFGVFLKLLLAPRQATTAPAQPQGLGPAAQQQAGLSDIARLIEALSKLSDSFARAGPAVMALVSSILFFLLAVLGAGLNAIAAK